MSNLNTSRDNLILSVLEEKPMTKQEICQKTGVKTSGMWDILNRLVNNGNISICGFGESKTGAKPYLYKLSNNDKTQEIHRPIQDRVLSLIKHGEISLDELFLIIGGRRSSIRNSANELINKGLIVRHGCKYSRGVTYSIKV